MVEFKVSYKLHLVVLLISAFISFVFIEDINLIFDSIITISMNFQFKMIAFTAILLLLVYSMSIIHELIHGFAYLILGGKVKIGFKSLYAYTKETSGLVLSSKQFLFVLLLPVILMSIPALFINHFVIQFIFIFNIIGSMGDIIMTLFVLRHGNKKIIDSDAGFIMMPIV